MNVGSDSNSKLLLWGLVGPCMILLTLSFAIFQGLQLSLYFSLAALLSFPLCWHWKLKGLIPSMFLLAILSLFLLQRASIHQQYLIFGVNLSLALGCLITVLSIEEITLFLLGKDVELDRRFNQIRKLVDEIAKMGRRNGMLEKKCRQVESDLDSYRNMVVYYQRSKKTVEKEQAVDRYQALYQQLREQFEEKNELLHQTRKELFHEREKAAALLKEKRESDLFGDPQAIELQKHIAELEREWEEEKNKYITEIRQLEELVSHFQNVTFSKS